MAAAVSEALNKALSLQHSFAGNFKWEVIFQLEVNWAFNWG